MSNVSSGSTHEKDAKFILELPVPLWNYEVCRTWRKAIRLPNGKTISTANDFFGAWDLIATRTDRLKFIQVTCPTELQKKITKILEHTKWCMKHDHEIWIWYGGRRHRNKCFAKGNENAPMVLAQCFAIYRLDHIHNEFKRVGVIDKTGELLEGIT